MKISFHIQIGSALLLSLLVGPLTLKDAAWWLAVLHSKKERVKTT